MTWLAGVARRDITPRQGVPLAGYPNPFRQNRGALDDLVLTSLVLSNETQTLAIVSVDVLALHEDVCDDIRTRIAEQSRLGPQDVLIGAIHSHSSPVASTLPSSPPQQRHHVAHLVTSAVDATLSALETLEPVTLRHGNARCRTAINRRALNAAGVMRIGRDHHANVDDAVDVVIAERFDGLRLAVVVNHACHPTILTLMNRRASAEWPGVMRRQVEAEAGGHVLFLQGATADANAPVGLRAGFGYRRVRALGTRVARAVVDAVRGAETLRGNQLASAISTASLGVIREHGRDTAGPAYVAALSNIIGAPSRAVPALIDHMYPWRNRQGGDDGRVPVELQALRIGDLALAAIGAEPFHQTGLAIKAASPARHTLVAGYSGGMVGYIAPPEQHSLRGYEVALSPYLYRFSGIFDVDAEPTIRAEMGRLLAGLFPGDAS